MIDFTKLNNNKILSFLNSLFKAIYLFFPGILFLLAYYFILIKMPIGQDLLMQAGEYTGPRLWTVVGVLIWMLFSWFGSRQVSNTYINSNNPKYLVVFEHAPRLIGYNVAVIIQIAFLNLETIDIPNYLICVLLIGHNMYYFCLIKVKFNFNNVWLYVSVFLAFIYIAFLIFKLELSSSKMAVYDDQMTKHVIWCFGMMLFFFFVQIAFVYLAIWKRKAIVSNRYSHEQRSNFKKAYNALALLTFILYIAILEIKIFADSFGGLGITLLAFALWVGFIYLVKNFTMQRKVKLGLPLLIFAFWVGSLYNPYKVRLQSTNEKNPYKDRPNIDQFFNQWINNNTRKIDIEKADSTNPFKVYVVIADGGASKSGYWVASVLSKLEENSDINDKFSKHLLSLAGASGGSVGNAAFFSLLYEQRSNKKVNFTKESTSFLSTDFFSSSFARFLGPDLFRHVFHFIFMDDRAAVLEQTMEEMPESTVIKNYFKRPVNFIYKHNGDMPMLFINTTELRSGSPGVVSNIKIDTSFSERLDILNFIDTSSNLEDRKQMLFSSSVILGARFPYISPAGEINNLHFVDGGYFDNTGGGVTLEMLQYIERKMKDSKDTLYRKYKNKLQFKVIYISNGDDHKEEEKKLNSMVNDLAAPLLTVAGTYGEQTSLSNKKLEYFVDHCDLIKSQSPFCILNLPMDSLRKDKIPYPMNWVISDFNLRRMNKNVEVVNVKDVLK